MTRTTRTHVELVGSLETFVRQRVASVAADWADNPNDVGRIAHAFGVIPLLFDWSAFMGMDANGTFSFISWDEPRKVDSVVSADLQDLAILSGLRFYPELATLLPERPIDATICKSCGGTGDLGLADNIVCRCGGLGWIPDYWAPWRAK